METNIKQDKRRLGRSCLYMSGIDEQERTFRCIGCGKATYWVLEGLDESEAEVLLGFLNNPDLNADPPLEIMKRYNVMSLHTVLVHIHRIKCGDCNSELLLDSLAWKKVSNKIKEMWERRAFV